MAWGKTDRTERPILKKQTLLSFIFLSILINVDLNTIRGFEHFKTVLTAQTGIHTTITWGFNCIIVKIKIMYLEFNKVN